MVRVLAVEQRPDGMTVLTLGAGATAVARVSVPTAAWHTLSAETLDQVVRAAATRARPPVRRR